MLFTSVDRSSRQKIDRETVALNDILDQMAFVDINNRILILLECTWSFSRMLFNLHVFEFFPTFFL